MTPEKSLGQIAFEAVELPAWPWERESEAGRLQWEASARAVAAEVRRRDGESHNLGQQVDNECFRERAFLAALTGLCANETFFKSSCGVAMDNDTPENLPSFFIDMATEVADAAIAARKEGK